MFFGRPFRSRGKPKEEPAAAKREALPPKEKGETGSEEELEKLYWRLVAAIKQQEPLRVVQEIVAEDPRVLQKKDSKGWLLMHTAARYSASVNVVRWLADTCPEAMLHKANDGWLPLHRAARYASAELVRCLAEKCPEAVLVKTDRGSLPLHIAAERAASVEVVRCLADKFPEAMLVKYGGGWLPLHMAACNASAEVVRCLAEKCPEAVLVKTDMGSLPLHIAAQHASLDVVHFLVDKHPTTLQETDREGRLPVDLARECNHEHPDVPAWLDAAMRDPHAQDRGRIRKAIEDPSHEPALVSVAYVESIRTDTFLGDGFFGTVFKGSDAVLVREFAIKSINTEILRGGSKQDLEDAMKTFKTEQEALSRFRHPNIAALFAYTDPLAERNAAGYHLVYELAEKGSLDRYLKDDLGRSRLGSFRRRVQVAIDVMTALQFLHKGNDQIKACFHRDVKSANIVLKRDFTAQLIDCGLAQFVNDDIKTTGIKGTKGYICPLFVDTGKFSAACDIYSFGVVLLELWTGRLQNYRDLSGALFNFKEQYIHGNRDVKEDADPAMDLGCPLPDFSTKFLNLALQCINERSRPRQSGDDALKSLKGVLDECSCSSDRSQGRCMTMSGDRGSNSSNSSRGGDVCLTCRTFNAVPQRSICALCLYREEVRKCFLEMASTFMMHASGAPAVEALSKQIEDIGNRFDPKLEGLSRQLDDVCRKIEAALPILAHLDRRLNNEVPRTFILLPGDVKSGWKHPRSWLRSKVQKKHYLFFVCPVSQKTVSPPIKLMVAKDWFSKAAPVLAAGLLLLQLGLKAGLNVSLDLDGTATELFHVSSDHIRQVLDELSSILKDCGDDGLLDRLQSGGSGGGSGSIPGLSDQDVRELSGDAYELVVEKACEQNGWRSQMEPVRLPPSPKVFWVSTSIAKDPKYNYEIVNA